MIAVSSFSLRSKLGPIRIGYRDAEGARRELELAAPAEIGFGEFARRARSDLGVGHIELCQIQLGSFSFDDARALRAGLDHAGVALLTMPIDVGDLADPDDDERERDLADTEKWFRIAQILGSRFVRVNAGSPFALAAPDLELLTRSFARLAETAEAAGLELLVENHGGASSDPDFLLELRNRVGAEHLGILLDLGNFEPALGLQRAAMTGGAPDPAPDFAPLFAAIEKLAPVASLVHAKAYGFDADDRPVLLDSARALEVVRASGYAGPITIEYEGDAGDPWRNTALTVDLVRRAGFAD